MFLVDEAYYEFSKETCANLVQKYENIVISRTLSKAFALANFRFGYLLASESNIKSISNIRNPKNITTFAQVAATAALSDIPYMENYVNEKVQSNINDHHHNNNSSSWDEWMNGNTEQTLGGIR